MYDICIIGGGIGGYTAAINGAKYNKRVLLVEKGEIGGTCLNRGCIPTKNLHHLAHYFEKSAKMKGNGITFDNILLNWSEARSKKVKIIEKLRGGVKYLLKANKVEFVKGQAEIMSKGKVGIEREDGTQSEIECNKIIIATGSDPILPEKFSYDGERIVSPDEFLDVKELPKSLLIVGGGIIGIEFASIFSALGVEITVLELQQNILTPVDGDARNLLTRIFKRKGIKIVTNCSVNELSIKDNRVVAGTSLGEFSCEKAVLALGRRANLKNLGLEKLLGENFKINPDNKMQTEFSDLFVIGDATGRNFLAHTALHEGIVASSNAAGFERKMHYGNIPITIFSIPEIAQIGKREDELKSENISYKVGRFPYSALGKAHAIMEEEGFIKILSGIESSEILGAVIIGADATNLIGEMIPIMGNRLKVNEIADLIHPHPTMTELIAEAIWDTDGKAIHKI